MRGGPKKHTEKHTFVFLQTGGHYEGQLAQLKSLIADDMASKSERIVINLPIYIRLADGLINLIDDRLDNLEYNYSFEGVIAKFDAAGSGISWYLFKTADGEEKKLYIG